MTIALFYSPGACSLAPHIILREAAVPFELIKVLLEKHKTQAGEDFYGINPKGYVPALRLENGEILSEGPAITQYIADLHPNSGLAPRCGTLERARVQEQLTFIGTEIHKSFAPLFYPATTEEAKQAAKDKIGKRFDLVEKGFADGRTFLMGPSFTIADAYLFVVANWTGRTGINLGVWPKLKAFHARVAARPHTQAALKAEGLV
jgi:glutathione S-transferase